MFKKNEYLMNLPLYRFGIEEKRKKNKFEQLLNKHLMMI
jgi:hypothetical protein